MNAQTIKHLDDGQLRAALDGELSPDQLHHLESCADCQARETAIRSQVGTAANRLAFLAGDEADPPNPAARLALQRFYNRKINQQEISMIQKVFRTSFVRIGLAFCVLLAVVVAIPSTRAFADQLLNLFRIQQVTVIPVDFTGIQQLTGNDALGKQISQLLSKSITMTEKPGDPQTAANAAQASQLAGFDVRLPQNLVPARISVESAAAFTFQVDRARAQALLDEAGRNDLVLPQEIDGADIAVKIPASVSAAYGTCPEPKSDGEGLGLNGGSTGRRYADCVILAEIPSPTVTAPASVDVAQLAQIGLEFTGMTREQAQAFTKTVDWTSSLVVPIPKNAATYQQIAVDGVTGTLIQRPADDAPQFALLWVKNGVIYTIGGLGSDSQKALQMANVLP